MRRQKIPNYIKKLVYEIYGGGCGRCSSKEDLNIHHEDRDPSNNSLYNLELLCFPDHWLEHNCRPDMLIWYLKQKHIGEIIKW